MGFHNKSSTARGLFWDPSIVGNGLSKYPPALGFHMPLFWAHSRILQMLRVGSTSMTVLSDA